MKKNKILKKKFHFKMKKNSKNGKFHFKMKKKNLKMKQK